MYRYLRSGVSYLLSCSLALGTTWPALASSAPQFPYDQLLAGHPLAELFFKSTGPLPKWGPFPADDTVLDSDPYFLRTQRWVDQQALAEDESVRVLTPSGSFQLQAPGSSVALFVAQPLTPVFEVDDYIFLQARSPAFFRVNDGEGLFFIDKRDLTQESFHDGRHGVPVFFLPLEGQGWTKAVDGVEVDDEAQVISLRNIDGESITMDLEDLDSLSKAYHFNILLAVAGELRFEPVQMRRQVEAAIAQGPNARMELPYVLPPRGSTAVFGCFATGINLDRPERSTGKIASGWNLRHWLLPQAEAASLLTPDALERVIIVGSITSGLLVTSVLAKFTVLKERVRQVRQHIEAIEDQQRLDSGQPPIERTFLRRLRSSSIDALSIFAQGLTTLEFAPKVLFGHLAEYLSDRYLGNQARWPNGLVRRFLKYTLLFDRANAEAVLANAKTLWYGTGVLGSIDTAAVVLQMLVISPYFFPWAGGLVSEQMRAQMAQQFSGNDAAMSNVVTSEIFRNVAGYMLKGPFSYAGDLVAIFQQLVQPEVEQQMRAEGKNPQDTRNHAEVVRRVSERLETLLVERGLPSSKETLFTAPSLFRRATQKMGYQVDRSKLQPGELSSNTQFILEGERWGTLNHVLKVAIDEAEKRRLLKRDSISKKAVEILKETKKEYNVLRRLMLTPWRKDEILAKGKKVREMLATLSYVDEGGLFGGSVRFLNVWKGFDENPQAGAVSALIFRQSLFSTLNGKPYYLRPSEAQLESHLPESLEEAEKRLRATVLPEIGFTDHEKGVMALEIVKERVAQSEEPGMQETWRLPTPKWTDFDFGTSGRQLKRIQAMALASTARALGRETQDLIDDPSLLVAPEAAKIFTDSYRFAMTRELGIYTYPSNASALVREVQRQTNEKLDVLFRTPIVQKYLDSLSASDKVKFVAHLHAETFVEKYAELTVSNSKFISLTSPEQPGFFQKWRNSALATRPGRLGRLTTIALRTLETPFSLNSYSLGGKSWRHRNLPLVRDINGAVKNKTKVLFATMTASYAVNYWIWQVKFSWPTYLFLQINLTLLTTVAYMLDRLMMNVGKPPMDKVRSKVIYAVIWTWVTYPLVLPFFFYNKDFNEWFDRFVTTPLTESISLCEKLLGGG